MSPIQEHSIELFLFGSADGLLFIPEAHRAVALAQANTIREMAESEGFNTYDIEARYAFVEGVDRLERIAEQQEY